jgi:hypothetical protein
MARATQLQHPIDDLGPVPEENQPGHHPKVDQDKPTGPPPTPKAARAKAAPAAAGPETAPAAGSREFAFAFDPLMAPVAALVGVLPSNSGVEVTDDEVVVRFGRWSMRVPRGDVESATVTGPYSMLKVAGPPRLSLADRGITFATNRDAGVCIALRRPHKGIEPIGLVKHPGLTVTVADPDELCRVLTAEG